MWSQKGPVGSLIGVTTGLWLDSVRHGSDCDGTDARGSRRRVTTMMARRVFSTVGIVYLAIMLVVP